MPKWIKYGQTISKYSVKLLCGAFKSMSEKDVAPLTPFSN